ncbi:MAG: ferrous iron transport protein A [Elusimicrobia bacterium CG06_land_8_20_14_3_00_38_11]|nr:MAG: ferrous iron transport protein A [Elusimicrobia bacterium CG06_land_8_20_14_3_00_38_11]
MLTSLLNLERNNFAKVVKIEGGAGFQKKLESLGLRLGVKIKKLSSSVFGGPVVIRAGRTNIAIGKGIASKIFVEIK